MKFAIYAGSTTHQDTVELGMNDKVPVGHCFEATKFMNRTYMRRRSGRFSGWPSIFWKLESRTTLNESEGH